MVDYLGEALLFFDLLVDEPLQEDVGRVVAFLHGWLPDGLEHDPAPSVGYEVEQLQGVRELLAVLELQPVREPAQAARVSESGHRQVKMGCVELAVDLFVNRVL